LSSSLVEVYEKSNGWVFLNQRITHSASKNRQGYNLVLAVRQLCIVYGHQRFRLAADNLLKKRWIIALYVAYGILFVIAWIVPLCAKR
jgi:hypothetical protein